MACRVFISYSHQDDDLREQLVQHLSPLVRNEDIDLWDDRRIAAGGKWREEVDSALSRCELALLLVSSHFLSSAFCRDVEVPNLLGRHEAKGVRIVPIILRPCLWTEDGLIARFKALPRDGKPVTEYRSRQRALTEVGKGIAELLEVPAVGGSPPSSEGGDDAAFTEWWEQINAAWPGDKGFLDDNLWEEEPQRRDQRWRQVEAVLEEFAELMGRRAAVEIVCGDFWYHWDDKAPTGLHFIRQKLRDFRKALSEQEFLPETRGNEGWYRTRWEAFTEGEGLLEAEHQRLQDAKAWGEEIGRIWHTPTQGYGKGKEQFRRLRERENPDKIRASVAAGKPRELRIMFYGAFSRLPEEHKQAWQRVRKRLEDDAAEADAPGGRDDSS